MCPLPKRWKLSIEFDLKWHSTVLQGYKRKVNGVRHFRHMKFVHFGDQCQINDQEIKKDVVWQYSVA